MSDAPDFIPFDQAPPGQPLAAHAPIQPGEGQPNAPDFIPNDDFISDEDKYGTTGQMAKTFVEGAGEGLLGPVAPYLEKKLLHVKPEDMLLRKEENPITRGAGQATTLVGGMMMGTGEAALMGKAGKMAAEAIPAISEGMAGIHAAELGLQAAKQAGQGVAEAKAALSYAQKATPLRFKVGEAAVQQAAEMAVLQSGDEVSKKILNDPKASTESAIANIGLSMALGGAGGAFMTGAVNPLWEATAGPKVEALLAGMKNHFNGNTVILPEEIAAAKNTLGIELTPEINAIMSGNPTAINHFHILKEAQNKSVVQGLEKFHNDLSTSVSHSLGIAPEDIAVHSENEAGHELLAAFKKEYDAKYGPIAEALEKRNAEAAHISIPDEARLDHYGKMLEDGMNKVGTDSPTYKLYNDYGNRLLAKDTIGGIDMLKTEINGEITKATRAGDTNAMMALRDIRSSLHDFQEAQIAAKGSSLEKLGVDGAKKSAADLLNERADTNRMYSEFAKMSGDLTDHLGVGDFKGFKTLNNKLTDKVSAEQLLNKFSIKGNADFIPFLKQHFPEVYEKVRENELKRFVKSAVLSAKGEQPLNIKKLGEIVDKGMAGQKEYVEAILPKAAIDRIAAANKLTESLPYIKSSNTAGWMTKMFADVPRNVMAGVAMFTGHNPVIGAIVGETAQRLGRDAPDAIRLAHLKYLGSDRNASAGAFKAMVDFFHNTYKGETFLAKATANVLKGGAQVITSSAMPNQADRDKLDKMVTKVQNNPDALFQAQNGQLGHYLPGHQQAMTQTTTQALQYLQGLKPHPHILGPLDKPVPPQPVEIARYNRALNIAQQPAVVLQHIKDGTLQRSDIADLHGMYPSLYKEMSAKLSAEMTKHHADEEPIPYKTRMGMSLFLGTPVDVSMNPSSIIAAQPMPKAPSQQPQQGGKSHKGTQSLGKSNKSYMTPGQASESDRSNRD